MKKENIHLMVTPLCDRTCKSEQKEGDSYELWYEISSVS